MNIYRAYDYLSRLLVISIVVTFLSACGGSSSDDLLSGSAEDDNSNPSENNNTQTSDLEGWDLVWKDDFDGTTLDSNTWTHELGTGSSIGLVGWGNNELQFYREENTTVSDGFLIIEAREESFGGQDFTSSRLKTQGKQFFKYGRIDVRAKLPEGQGMWPAIWMLGENISTVAWPASGEIDIMEMIGGSNRENTVHGTIHWDNGGGHSYSGGSSTLPSGSYSDDFHVFSIEWDSSFIKWFIDGEQFHSESIIPASKNEFKNSFFFLLNVAVGGDWPGSPDSSTSFPQQMVIDYIRVYEAM